MNNSERKQIAKIIVKVEDIDHSIEKHWNPFPGDVTDNPQAKLQTIKAMLNELLNPPNEGDTMIDQEKFYWACRKYGLGKLTKALGLSETGFQRKMKNPTEKFYVDEYVKICQLLHPEAPALEAIAQYLVTEKG